MKLRFYILAGGLLLVILAAGIIARPAVDLVSLLIAAGTLGFIAIVWRVANHLLSPKREYSIEASVVLEDPIVPRLGRHHFRAEIKTMLLEKGQWRITKSNLVEVRERAASMSEFKTSCMQVLRAELEAERVRLQQVEPKAVISVKSPALQIPAPRP